MKDVLLEYLIKKAVVDIHARCVILFGSRARGDQGERSDYDIAFDAPQANAAIWAEFVLSAREQSPTLHSLDLVWLQECSAALKNEITREGVVVYEEKNGSKAG